MKKIRTKCNSGLIRVDAGRPVSMIGDGDLILYGARPGWLRRLQRRDPKRYGWSCWTPIRFYVPSR